MLVSRIGQKIEESGYTRKYIRVRMGNISANTLSNWCTSKSFPPAPQLFKLARLLNCTVEDLYIWEEDNR